MNDTKEIQEQRMRRYFIEATKDLLRAEGLRSVSVRKVAERAGYSYATMYHYFNNVQDLVFESVADFSAEIDGFVANRTADLAPGCETLRAIYTATVAYFVQYPGIFELFYLERGVSVSRRSEAMELIRSLLDRQTRDMWAACVAQGVFSEKDAGIRARQLNYALLGAMLLYMNRRHPQEYGEFNAIIDEQLDYGLKEYPV